MQALATAVGTGQEGSGDGCVMAGDSVSAWGGGGGGDVEAMQAVCWNVRGESLRAQQGSRGEVRLLV